MIKISTMILLILVATACSTSLKRFPSSEPKAGDVYKIGLDPSAAFEKSGEKLVVNVDWDRVYSKLTDQKSKDDTKFCAQQLERVYRNFNNINILIGRHSEYTHEETEIMRSIGQEGVQGAFNLCEGILGEEKAKQTNKQVIESLKGLDRN